MNKLALVMNKSPRQLNKSLLQAIQTQKSRRHHPQRLLYATNPI